MKAEYDKKIKEEIEKTLNAFDESKKIEANPFLFTRIKATISAQTDENPVRGYRRVFPLRLALLIVLFLLNIVSIIYFSTTSRSTSAGTESFIDSLTDDYYLSASDALFINLNEKE